MINNVILALTAFATALMAGLFYSYSCLVNPGLGKLGDAEYLASMQSINREILNPAFFAAFFGALILLPVSAYISYNRSTLRFSLLAAAAVVYIIGLVGVTVRGNIPLNEMLDKFAIAKASSQELSAMRASFESSWNRYHSLRTISVIVSLLLVLIAFVFGEKTTLNNS